jgi:hypothetical protein
MSWRLGVSVAVVTVVSIVAVVIAIMSATGAHGAERIEGAIRWPTNCTNISVVHPSHAAIVSRWGGSTVSSADIVCPAVGAGVAYARFRNQPTLDSAIAAHEPSQRYCLVGPSIVIDELAATDATIFTDMCRTLSGTVVNNAH